MGTVNIFLGGTGKHIAEDIQDSRDFFGHQISEPIAFDLDPARRAGVDLRGFVHPSQETVDSVVDIAQGWASRELGPGVGPAQSSSTPGPQQSPEHSVLVAVGEGIAENPLPSRGLFALRGHGLTVFSALFDPSLAIAGAGAGNTLRKLIDTAIDAEKAGDELPRINLITSTAGGTGAGTVIPLALWLKERYKAAPLTLIAVTPEAFSTVLSGSPNLNELAAKGRSGTYAMFRELSFLQEVDPQARFSPRSLPVTDDGLAYLPGQKLFDRVYWFGGRGASRPNDAFEEAGALLRILSSDNTAEELRGKTGAHPLQSVGALTAVEYPKLRLQRKLVSRVLVAAYDRLRAGRQTYEGAASDREISLLDYVGEDTPRRLGAWLYEQRNASLALHASHSSTTSAAAGRLVDRIHAEGEVDDYASAPRGTRIRGDNYDAGEPGWRAYVAEFTEGLRRISQRNQEKLQRAIPAMRGGEEAAFGGWIRDTVFGEDGWLSGEASDGARPDGIEDVRHRLERLEQDARELEDRIGQDNFIGSRSIAELDDEIDTRTNKLAKPDDIKVQPSALQRLLALGVAAAVALVGGLALRPVWEGISRFGEFDGTSASEILVWVGVTLAAVLAYRGVTWVLLRSRKDEASLQSLRRAAENRLIAAFRERDRVRALQWLQLELRGPDGKPPLFRELRQQVESVHAAVDDLDSLYKGLRDQAATEVAETASNPAHVRATVGDCLDQDQGVDGDLVPEISRRLRVDAALGPDQRVRSLHLRLEPLSTDDEEAVKPASVDVRDVLVAIDPERSEGRVEERESENRWKDSLWSLVNWRLGEKLPGTFEEALLYCAGHSEEAATRELVTKLNGLDLPRRSSVALRVPASDPVFRQIYVGSDAIQARFVSALNDPTLDRAARARLQDYAADGYGVVPSLGEQVVFLDLWADDGGQPWAPHVISSAVEARDAIDTYYGATSATGEATARETCFTIIPELLAATRIELGGNVDPLHPAVTARLLGSDLDVQGPTYAELFHLLRARGHIVEDRQGAGPSARTVIRLSLDDARPLDLVTYAPGGADDPLFRAGRADVVAFDAFCEFMRFKGAPRVVSDGGFQPFPNAPLADASWRNDPRRIARLQQAAVLQRYQGDIQTDCEAMVAVLERDLQRMENADPNVRRSWEQAMRRLLDGEERRGIRETWLRTSNR